MGAYMVALDNTTKRTPPLLKVSTDTEIRRRSPPATTPYDSIHFRRLGNNSKSLMSEEMRFDFYVVSI